MFDKEKHKDDFFQYIIDNEKELQKALKKNITYDPDIFDDVTADTIIRLAEYIMNKEMQIRDFKSLFFMAAKRQYIAEQNKKRNRVKQDIPNFIDIITEGSKNTSFDSRDISYLRNLTDDGEGRWVIQEERANRINEFYNWLQERLNEEFLPVEADIFIFYYRLKSNKTGVSYKKLAKILDVPVKFITDTIVKIKKYIRESEEIQNKKREMIDRKDD